MPIASNILLHLLLLALAICSLTIIFTTFLNIENDQFQEVKTGPALNIVLELKERAGIKETVRLFVKKREIAGIAYVDQSVEGGRKEFGIFTSQAVIDKWPEAALRGMFAHEFGHIILKHTESVDETQTRADVVSVELVGRDAALAHLSRLAQYQNQIQESRERKRRLERALEEKEKRQDH